MAAKKDDGVVKATRAQEVDGLEMGVLEDGTPFLSSRALARLAGVVPSAILGWVPTFDWSSEKPRDSKLRELLQRQGISSGALFVKADREGVLVNAHNDAVCMAVLEYYAFEAGAGVTEQAITAFRFLGRRSLRDFIYTSVGYDPRAVVPELWQHFHNRVLLNPVPQGYFSVFREIGDVIVSSIRNGLKVDEHTVPDISVGQSWAAHWKSIGGETLYGVREKYPHVYPEPAPQANAEIEAWIYPVMALGPFRAWLQGVYLPEKYPRYIDSKVRSGALLESRAELLLKAVSETPKLPGEPDLSPTAARPKN